MTTYKTSMPTTTSPPRRWHLDRIDAADTTLGEHRDSGERFPLELTFKRACAAMATQFVKSERLRKLPPYLFAEIDKKKKAAIAAGRDIINLGVGDPDRPTPEAIIRSLQHHVENPAFHQYALDQGSPELRRSIAAFCQRRYAHRPRSRNRSAGLDRLEGGAGPSCRWPCSTPARSAWFPTRAIPSIVPAACSPAPTFTRCPWNRISAFCPILKRFRPTYSRWRA